MKDSGIEWIGEIPENWRVKKIKYLANGEENSFIDGDWIESGDIQSEGIRYLTTGNIGDGVFKKQGDGFISEETFKKLNCKFAYPEDLVFSRLNSPFGRSCLLPNDFDKYVLAVDNVILRTDENKKFLCYLTQCEGYHHSAEDSSSGTTMKRLSRTSLGNLKIILPPLEEQQKIADFLDKKCSKIDEQKANYEKSIELLKEYKQSLITKAVTKGLNNNTELKDSGVDWIGNIPKHRLINRSKIHFKLQNSKGNTILTLLSATQKYGMYPQDKIEGAVRLSEEKDLNSLKTVHKGDFVISLRSFQGGFELSRYEGVCSPAYSVFHGDNVVDIEYYKYFFKSSCFIDGINTITTGIRDGKNIGFDDFSNLRICFPPVEEQKQIADYLDKECGRIDKVISYREEMIEKIEEYKKSLIYEYVTAKKEVL